MPTCDVCSADCEWAYDEDQQRWVLTVDDELHSHGRCRRCGENCLWKQDDDDNWRLFDEDEPHTCGGRY